MKHGAEFIDHITPNKKLLVVFTYTNLQVDGVV